MGDADNGEAMHKEGQGQWELYLLLNSFSVSQKVLLKKIKQWEAAELQTQRQAKSAPGTRRLVQDSRETRNGAVTHCGSILEGVVCGPWPTNSATLSSFTEFSEIQAVGQALAIDTVGSLD